ncbi:bifunctional UDP-N-acetylmuramoyl-tripeptide:D-alanyl-D-alanine ligase/alanine racemase [Flavobacterium agricola]|uniref:Alanine racemase n=1 Tax=Flavobacterium agricola TaxID=2870839 RepID=A0ABY6LY05_9FLAO|nr:bifunctional UDP-N-acetylmuramoyl-tripeptide:D-alanyl-D-alanine ligase/alanine racemase [Flavobacterium agricola]UYW01220.1 bifunctional UDP-N-acetylmuramoyl-tripeptide:D-alanyl-D-alanine ligase/alanine racemase [Flavobacterium agricola]
MNVTLKQVAQVIQAEWQPTFPDEFIDHISIDSRSLQNNSTTLFFALTGANHDAHVYINDLYKKGVVNFVVQAIPTNFTGAANFLVVENTLKALQSFTVYYRSLFSFPVIGITGSNGKTIVKEWLNYLMNTEYNIIRSPKSYNSQVGVPLSVLASNENHDLGIFEAGISLPNEMAVLEQMILPTIGVLTHLGDAHKEGFTSFEQKVDEKLLLFKQVEALILEYNPKVLERLDKSIKTFTWSTTNPAADVLIKHSAADLYHVITRFTRFDLIIKLQDEQAIANVCTCVATLLFFNYDVKLIQDRIKTLYPIELRLQVKDGLNGCTVIDDTYNSDYQSLKIALDFLDQHKSKEKKTVILSDIFQSGFQPEVVYKKVGKLLQSNAINRIIGIGPKISTYLKDLPNFSGFASTADFLLQFSANSFQNETILIKGARSFKFDEIVVLLEQQTHETVLEINLNAVTHNLNFYKSLLQPQTKIMVMVKAFGYGAGSFEIAKELQFHQVDYLGVAYADEGAELRRAGITIPIIVMNPEPGTYATLLAYQLEPEIYSLRSLHGFIDFVKAKNVSSYPIHLKLDTGMHRLGFEAEQLDELVAVLKNNNWVKVASIFSHLSSSDVPAYKDFTLQQIQKFDAWSQQVIDALQINPIRHILNTSGIFNYSAYQYNMVRLGIGLYGVGNDEQENKQLQNVGTLKTIILQIRNVNAGESIGYSRRYQVTRPKKVATIPIGYADGIPRAWGNEKGYVLIQGKKATILGSICMDAMMVDVTDIVCNEGDEVLIFGQKLPVTELAKQLNTIPYEILTSISQRVKRIFYKE